MEATEFILTIVFGTFVFVSFLVWMKMRHETLKAKHGGMSDEAVAELKDLRNRVQTLERILTDRPERLREEIDAL